MAKQRGKVRGDKLTVKTASSEFSAPLTELHDARWNSIARATAEVNASGKANF